MERRSSYCRRKISYCSQQPGVGCRPLWQKTTTRREDVSVVWTVHLVKVRLVCAGLGLWIGLRLLSHVGDVGWTRRGFQMRILGHDCFRFEDGLEAVLQLFVPLTHPVPGRSIAVTRIWRQWNVLEDLQRVEDAFRSQFEGRNAEHFLLEPSSLPTRPDEEGLHVPKRHLQSALAVLVFPAAATGGRRGIIVAWTLVLLREDDRVEARTEPSCRVPLDVRRADLEDPSVRTRRGQREPLDDVEDEISRGERLGFLLLDAINVADDSRPCDPKSPKIPRCDGILRRLGPSWTIAVRANAHLAVINVVRIYVKQSVGDLADVVEVGRAHLPRRALLVDEVELERPPALVGGFLLAAELQPVILHQLGEVQRPETLVRWATTAARRAGVSAKLLHALVPLHKCVDARLLVLFRQVCVALEVVAAGAAAARDGLLSVCDGLLSVGL